MFLLDQKVLFILFNLNSNRGESKNRLKFLCLPEYHNTLRLLLLRVNYIQLQRKSDNFHGLTVKTKRILGLKLGQIQVHIIMTCALHSVIYTKHYKSNSLDCSQSVIH